MTHYACPSCGRDYAYELDGCSWCRMPLEVRAPLGGVVETVTEVSVASPGHEDVPYWCALVAAEDGSRAIVKLDHPVDTGDLIPLGTPPSDELPIVGILGTGAMGRGLAELLLARGHRVVWVSRTQASADEARARLFERLGRVMDDEEIEETSRRLTTLAEVTVLADCDVVIEAVIEELEPKKAALRDAEAAMRDDAVLATNTSGLPLDELASVLARPERFGVLHFFNPPNRMRLVETSLASATSEQTGRFLDEFSRALGKSPVRVKARPAFVVNRVLMPLINEAVRSLEEGAASAEHIDEAVRLGLNHPMGPLALADLIGLDVVVEIMDTIARETGDATYEPRPLLRDLVGQGRLGRKTHEGFYDYARRT